VRRLIWALLALPLAWAPGAAAIDFKTKDFWTFESGQVRPLALSADRSQLIAVNTPDNRLELYDVSDTGLRHRWSVPVGMEPVAVAYRDPNEVWVVNHLSDSVSIVDLRTSPPRVVRTLLVADEPRDIVFAGTGGNLAFITTARRGQNSSVDPLPLTPGDRNNTADPTDDVGGRALVWVFDANSLGTSMEGDPVAILEMYTDTPRALAASDDGSAVYAAGFHTGNGTTTVLEQAISVVQGSPFDPGTNLPTVNVDGVTRPEVGAVVFRQGGGWVDEQERSFINNIVGLFDNPLPELDVFRIDATASPPVVTDEYPQVGTILFNMVVANGKLYVSNTEANNRQRFEGPGTFWGSSLRGHLHEARVTVIDANAPSVSPRPLNKHLRPYTPDFDDPNEAAKSLATPLGMAVTGDGNTLYLAAFGSSKIGVFSTAALDANSFVPDANAHIALSEEGPSGLVLDEPRNRLYALTRFGNSITVVDISTSPGSEDSVVAVPHDPEPAVVRDGRPFLYDALATSSNGEASCSSCHVFADFDSLAWDLGNPDGGYATNPNPFVVPPPVLPGFFDPNFHPMKGPMTVQSLRGMENHGAEHWRGDRTGGSDPNGDPLDAFQAFMKFIVAFEGLLGRTGPIEMGEMMQFTNFILEVAYPPNPLRALDNSEALAHDPNADLTVGRDIYNGVFTGRPGLPGNSGDGSDGVGSCNFCHVLSEPNGFFGTAGGSTFEGEPQAFKVPHLRNMYQKVGMFGAPGGPDLGAQVRGSGYLHDGGVDTVLSFVSAQIGGMDVFAMSGNEAQRLEKRTLLSLFLLAFPSNLAPIVGQQVTLTSTNGGTVGPRIDLMIARALVTSPRPECDLIVKGRIAGEARGWVMTASDTFESDRDGEGPLSDASLRALAATSGQELTYTCAPPGSGLRMGVDRDLDGVRDGSQCGDGNVDGAIHDGDDLVIREGLALKAALPAAHKCNVVGPADTGDDDGDGVPNDCQLDDAAALFRFLNGLGTLGTSC
jgi:DNA-binding beta-propeller fold protein YncE